MVNNLLFLTNCYFNNGCIEAKKNIVLNNIYNTDIRTRWEIQNRHQLSSIGTLVACDNRGTVRSKYLSINKQNILIIDVLK